MWNRGCLSFSSKVTDQPRRDSSAATVHPAGPPPATMTSHCRGGVGADGWMFATGSFSATATRMIHLQSPRTARNHVYQGDRKMAEFQTKEQRELAALIVTALNLEGIDAATIDPDAPLFGAGLELDSIDALELALEISKRYGVQIKADDEDNKAIFASLRTLSDYVERMRAA